jgi:glycosyltransferase involved in cell wall biosynthesis
LPLAKLCRNFSVKKEKDYLMDWAKTAIIHEWLVSYAGSERCVESFTNIWKDADVFALVDFLNEEQRDIILKGKKSNTTFIQKLPLARKKHRYYLPLFPAAIERLNLSDYKLIISSNHSVSKGVKTNKNQLHISYCHSPMRYAWDQSDQYLRGIKGSFAKAFMNYLRKWDLKSAGNVNYFIANSHHIAEKIKRIYKRDSAVIYPPVDVDKFEVSEKKEDYYLIASRFVPYKKVDLVVEAFNKMPDKKLVVIGSGPEKEKVKNIAGTNIEFIPYQPTDKLKEYLKKAKAFVFAAEEDFGIVVVEAMACGTPVIALNKGGTAESVINNKTGILFDEQNPESIINAVKEFEKRIDYFDTQFIRKHAEKFNRGVFEENIKQFVKEKLESFTH